MSDDLHEVGEVIEHAAHEIGASAGDEAQHREIRVPVVDLAETATRNDVWLRERDERRARIRGVGRTGKRRPERSNVLLHALARVGSDAFSCRSRQLEVLLHERAEVELRWSPLGGIARGNLGWRQARPRVDERLGIGEYPGQLDIVEERTERA